MLSLRFLSLVLEIKSVNIFSLLACEQALCLGSQAISLLAFRKYSISLHDKHTRAVNLTRAIQRGMICFFFRFIKQSNNNKRDRRENNRTILTKHMSDLANLLPVRSSVVIDLAKSSLQKQRKSEQKNGRQNKRNQQTRLIEPLINLGGGH